MERKKTIYRQQFTEAIQLEHEDFSTFVIRLGRLARFGYSDESPAMVQMRVEEKGIQSYRDMLIRQFLLENEGKPWGELVKLAQRKEDVKKMARRMTSRGAGSGATGAIATSISEESSGLVASVCGSLLSNQWLKRGLEAIKDRIVKKLSLTLSSAWTSWGNNSASSNRSMRRSYAQQCKICKSSEHQMSKCPEAVCFGCGNKGTSG